VITLLLALMTSPIRPPNQYNLNFPRNVLPRNFALTATSKIRLVSSVSVASSIPVKSILIQKEDGEEDTASAIHSNPLLQRRTSTVRSQLARISRIRGSTPAVHPLRC
jgi:hypothetical protein